MKIIIIRMIIKTIVSLSHWENGQHPSSRTHRLKQACIYSVGRCHQVAITGTMTLPALFKHYKCTFKPRDNFFQHHLPWSPIYETGRDQCALEEVEGVGWAHSGLCFSARRGSPGRLLDSVGQSDTLPHTKGPSNGHTFDSTILILGP